MDNRDELIDTLVDLEDAPFDREQLEAMEDSQLQVVARGQGVLEDDTDDADDDPAGEPDSGDEPKAQADDDEPEGDDADDVLADLSDEERETLARLASEGESLSDVLDRVDRLESLLDEAEEKANAREEEKDNLVDTLSDRETVSLSEDGLRALSLEDLEKLERDTDPDRNFVARGSRANRRRGRKETESYLDENPRTPNVLLGGSSEDD